METHTVYISVGSVWRQYLLALYRRPFYVSLIILLLRVPWTSLGYNTTGQLKSCSFCWFLFGIVEMKRTRDKACRKQGM